MALWIVTAASKHPEVEFLIIRATDETDALSQASEYVADETWTATPLLADGPAAILAGAERACWELTNA